MVEPVDHQKSESPDTSKDRKSFFWIPMNWLPRSFLILLFIIIFINVLITLTAFFKSEDAQVLKALVATKYPQTIHRSDYMTVRSIPIDSDLQNHMVMYGYSVNWFKGKFTNDSEIQFISYLDPGEQFVITLAGNQITQNLEGSNALLQNTNETYPQYEQVHQKPLFHFDGRDHLYTHIYDGDNTSLQFFNPITGYPDFERTIADHPLGFKPAEKVEFPEDERTFFVFSDTKNFELIVYDLDRDTLATVEDYPRSWTITKDQSSDDFHLLTASNTRIRRYRTDGTFLEEIQLQNTGDYTQFVDINVVRFDDKDILVADSTHFRVNGTYFPPSLLHFNPDGSRIWLESEDQIRISNLVLAKKAGIKLNNGNTIFKNGELVVVIDNQGNEVDKFGFLNQGYSLDFYYDSANNRAVELGSNYVFGGHLFIIDYQFHDISGSDK